MMETKDQDVAFHCADGTMMSAFISRPKNGEHPGIIVIHEAFGLNEQIRGVAKRYAQEGYVTIAPNLFSRNSDVMNEKNIESTMRYMWNVPSDKRGDPDTIKELMSKMSDTERKVVNVFYLGREEMEKRMAQDLLDCTSYLQSLDFVVKDKLGIMGFCLGGGLTYQLSTMYPFNASVPFYGANPKPLSSVENVSGPVLAFYAGEDERINAGVPPLVEAMVRYKKQFSLKIYKGAQHSFFNETRPSYNKEAAADAWESSVAFFNKNLK
jgi:carboxymethylenebutenolidase